MTIANTATTQQYIRNGVTTQWSYPNKIFAAADLIVTDLDTSVPPNAVTLVLGTDYTVASVDIDTGPLITTTVAGVAGHTLDIRSRIAQTQTTSIKNQGSFLPELHEEFFDRITREVQDLTRLAYTFSIKGPDNEVPSWPVLPPAATRRGNALMFDAITGLPTLGVPNTQTITLGLLAPFLNLNQSPTELAVGVTPVNLFWPVGYLDRYGTNTTPGTTDMSAATQNWMKVGLVAGGELLYGPGPYLLNSAINCTFAGAGGCPGVTVRSLGTSHNTNSAKSGFILNHTSIGFDCTGNDTIQFIDPIIKTVTSPPPANIPICAILFARNTSGASLINRVIRPKIVGYFSVAPVYNYGSEDFVIENGYLANYNTAANTSCITYTANNIAGLTSIVGGLIATGAKSTTAIDSLNMTLLQAGATATSDCVRLEGVSGYHQFGGWMDADTGRAAIYVDQTNTTCQDVRIYAMRTEHTATPVKYGILFGAAGVARISTGWSISHSRLETTVNCIAAVDANSTLDGLTVDSISEQTSLGMNIPGTIQGFSQLRVGGMVLNIGALLNTLVIGLPSNWTIGSKTTSMLLSMTAQQVAGFGTPVGGAVINNYNITDAGGANSNTNKCVAEILVVLKAAGLIAT